MNAMKIARTLLAICLGLGWLCGVWARPLADIQKNNRIVIATEGQYVPFNFFQGSKLTGFEVDLAELLAKKMSLSVEWKAVPFDSLLVGLRQDRWDMVIASHGVTEERSKSVGFADPHYCSGGVIVSKNWKIRNPQDLPGLVIGAQVGTTYLDKVKELVRGAKEIKAFPQDLDARNALLSGRVDVWVTDQFVAMQARGKDKAASPLEIGNYLFIEHIAAAAAKGNRSLLDAWNKALAEAMQDGSYAALSKKYFGADIRCPM